MSREFNNKYIGQRLLRVREARGISQKDFASSLDISLSGYQNYERGNRSLTKDLLIMLYEKYKLDTTWLLFGNRKTSYDSISLEQNQGIGPIILKNFGYLTGLRFTHGALARISIDTRDAVRFLEGCIEHENNIGNIDNQIIKSLELLRKHYDFQEEDYNESDLQFIAEVELPPNGIKFVPERPRDERLPLDIK